MDKSKLNFRIAGREDIEGIIKLCDECFEETTNLEYAYRIFDENVNDKNQIYLVGEYEKEIIAHTKITIIPTIYENMNTYSIINHVCVRPDFRRHNVATIMLDEVKKICREHKCKTIELWSRNFRQAAHACYLNYGFKIDDAKFFIYDIEE